MLSVAEEKAQRVLIAATRLCRFANSEPSDEGNLAGRTSYFSVSTLHSEEKL